MAAAEQLPAEQVPGGGGDDGSGGNCCGAAEAIPPTPSRRQRRLSGILEAESVDKRALAELAWSGVPKGLSRCEVWQLLLDYRPLSRERRQHGLQRKREEYQELRSSLYENSAALTMCSGGASPGQLGTEGRLLRQIRKDLPRTQARFDREVSRGNHAAAELVVRSPQVHAILERVLFVWAVRQPASGYVQGIDGILLLVLLVFLADRRDGIPENLDMGLVDELGEERLAEIEADCYWCVSKVLSMLYDHYTDGFPGIQRMAAKLMELMWRIDAPLAEHLDVQGVDVFETAVRWVGCLMVRELPVAACARLWDALIAESVQAGDRTGAGFESLLLYFCFCFLARFSIRFREMDFEEITMFLKRAESEAVSEADVEVLLGEAFVLKSMFGQAPNHLTKGLGDAGTRMR